MPNLALGIVFIIGGIFYFIYSRKQIREKMEKSGYFKKSIIVTVENTRDAIKKIHRII